MPGASLSGKLGLLVAAVTALAATVAAVSSAAGAPPLLVGLLTAGLGLVAGLLLVGRFLGPPTRVVRALANAVEAMRSGDFSVRLAPGRSDELGDLVAVYNDLAEVVSRERGDIRQRELLLESVLETSPAAVLLVNAADRVLYASRSARRFFAAGRRLEGHTLAEVLERCPETLRHALVSGRDSLVTVSLRGEEENLHVTRRTYELNALRHTLLMVRHMTPELRRQEVAVWKKVIRTIGHELNNSLAPIRSLVSSARLLSTADPPRTDRLHEVYDTIDECATRLHRFVDGYARFARLPEPRLEPVQLETFVAGVRQLEPFSIHGEVPEGTVHLDPAQIQQVLVNLVKNAREAGSPVEHTSVALEVRGDGQLVIEVRDRGCGMDEETMDRALLPFYSSKQQGTGLGLSLSREIVEAHGGRLLLAEREGGGLVVTCRLPARSGG